MSDELTNNPSDSTLTPNFLYDNINHDCNMKGISLCSDDYCTIKEVVSLFGDISDTVSTETAATAIANSSAWIESNLKKNYVPIPTTDVNALRTIAIYHSASDILLTLYHGEDLPVQYDVWFNKAQTLLNDYINAYLNSDAEDEDLISHQMVKHSHGRTYNQKRKRNMGVRRWVK